MGRTRYVGTWSQPVSEVIQLDFTVENPRTVLASGVEPKQSSYTHRDIADWCYGFWLAYYDIDAPDEIKRILPVLEDVDAQWDLYLSNTYGLEELQKLDFGLVRLPPEWFEDWIRKLQSCSLAI